MHQTISTSNIKRLTPPIDLVRRILQRIEIEKLRQKVRRSLVAWISITCLSVAGLVVTGIFFFQEAATSGFSAYISQMWALLRTNPGLVIEHWQDILTSVSEALPVVGLVGVAITIGLALWSADKVIGFGRKWRAV